MTKAYTAMLRAFIETDPPKKKKSRSTGEGGQGGRRRRSMTPRNWKCRKSYASVGRMLGHGSGPMLIFDCETETKIGQRLRLGIFQERGLNYRDFVERKKRHGIVTRNDMDAQRSGGIFYNPEACIKTEVATMRTYADEHGLNFMTLKSFCYKLFFRIYYLKSWQKDEMAQTLPMLVIGHNLPFDSGGSLARSGQARGAISAASRSRSPKNALPSQLKN